MARKQRLKPTVSRPNFVGKKLSKVIADSGLIRLLSQKLPIRRGIPQGEISGWIQQLIKGPPGLVKPNPGQELETLAYMGGCVFNFFGVRFEPPKIAEFFEELNLTEQRQSEFKGRRDPKAEITRWKEVGERIGVRVVINGNELFSNLRAFQSIAACWLRHKTDPIALIDRAREGDRQAVLDLIKVDKLFLHDSCTRNVMNKAELEYDRRFLRQVARATNYEPKFGKKTATRLYLFTLYGLNVDPSTLKKDQHLLDPEGKVFPGFYGFERFVERCFEQFMNLQSGGIETTLANQPPG